MMSAHDGVKRRRNGSRRYESEIRRRRSAETRRRILECARDLVVEKGYAGTTVAEVARRAGVHVDTIYALVGRKPVILHELVENAISGTDHAVDPLERDYVQAMRVEPDAGRKLDLYAGAMSRIHERLAPLFLALRDASRADPEAGRIWSAISERRALNMRRLADDLLSTGPDPPRPDTRPGGRPRLGHQQPRRPPTTRSGPRLDPRAIPSVAGGLMASTPAHPSITPTRAAIERGLTASAKRQRAPLCAPPAPSERAASACTSAARAGT